LAAILFFSLVSVIARLGREAKPWFQVAAFLVE